MVFDDCRSGQGDSTKFSGVEVPQLKSFSRQFLRMTSSTCNDHLLNKTPYYAFIPPTHPITLTKRDPVVYLTSSSLASPSNPAATPLASDYSCLVTSPSPWPHRMARLYRLHHLRVHRHIRATNLDGDPRCRWALEVLPAKS
jgi:hypothetical protein